MRTMIAIAVCLFLLGVPAFGQGQAATGQESPGRAADRYRHKVIPKMTLVRSSGTRRERLAREAAAPILLRAGLNSVEEGDLAARLEEASQKRVYTDERSVNPEAAIIVEADVRLPVVSRRRDDSRNQRIKERVTRGAGRLGRRSIRILNRIPGLPQEIPDTGEEVIDIYEDDKVRKDNYDGRNAYFIIPGRFQLRIGSESYEDQVWFRVYVEEREYEDWYLVGIGATQTTICEVEPEWLGDVPEVELNWRLLSATKYGRIENLVRDPASAVRPRERKPNACPGWVYGQDKKKPNGRTNR